MPTPSTPSPDRPKRGRPAGRGVPAICTAEAGTLWFTLAPINANHHFAVLAVHRRRGSHLVGYTLDGDYARAPIGQCLGTFISADLATRAKIVAAKVFMRHGVSVSRAARALDQARATRADDVRAALATKFGDIRPVGGPISTQEPAQ